MKLLLDTNAYSALMRGERGAMNYVGLSEHIYLCMTVIGELLYGFRRGAQAQENIRHLNRFLAQPTVGLIGADYETCEVYARIGDGVRKSGKPIPTNDQWIASTAMRNNFVLLTADRHFEWIEGLSIERW